MENDNQLQEISPESKPILLKIITWGSIVLGLFILLSSIWLSISLEGDPFKPASERIMEALRMVIAFALMFGGFGLLKMKKWGLYLFSVVALYFVIGAIFFTSWSSWRWFGIWVLILQIGIIIGGIFSLVYLWKIRTCFK